MTLGAAAKQKIMTLGAAAKQKIMTLGAAAKQKIMTLGAASKITFLRRGLFLVKQCNSIRFLLNVETNIIFIII